ncbi:MAG: BON domain-containing protein [Myxococcota bacterium]
MHMQERSSEQSPNSNPTPTPTPSRALEQTPFLKPVAVFAPESWRAPLAKVLDGLPHAKRWFGESEVGSDALQTGSAIVVSGGDNGENTVIPRLRAMSWFHPVMAIVPTNASEKTSIQMYEAGASLVIAWPEEVSMLASLFTACVHGADYPSVSVLARGTDRLAYSLNARRKLMLHGCDNVDIEVADYMVKLSGPVPSLRAKRALIALVRRTPGVKSVNSRRVVIRGRRVSATELTADVRAALRMVDRIDTSTVCAVADHRGQVTLAGTVADGDEQRLMRRVVATVPGVVDIEDLTTRSSVQKDQDHHAAKTAKRLLRTALNEDASLHVSVFGPIGFVTGEVEDRRQVRQAKKALLKVQPIERVISEIQVRA